ncbi:MAG: hypothetical protein IKE75_04070 [Bacilli bacterium]|nr:hypothetical protein [Bacilli bacterium]
MKLQEIKKEKQELLNLKEALLLIKFWTVPDIEHIKEQNRKGKVKVLTRYPKPRY